MSTNLDELMANAWPAATVEMHGRWRFRWTNGVTRRANSVLAVDEEDRTEALMELAERFYAARGVTPVVLVSEGSAPPSLTGFLHDHGYRTSERVLVLSAAVSDVVASTSDGPTEADVAPTYDDAWFDVYWTTQSEHDRSDADQSLFRDVLLRPPLPTWFASVRDGDRVVGVGQAVIESGRATIQCMATSATHRRRGVGRAVLGGLARALADDDVTGMQLAVLAENAGAINLYTAAGFVPAHAYTYFRRPIETPSG